MVGGVGTAGTFVFDVLPALKAALEPIDPALPPADFFSIQGRVDETQTGSGLGVRTTATGNLAAFLEPQLDVTIGGSPLQLPVTFSITVGPLDGTLTNSLGQAVDLQNLPEDLPGSEVTYTPNLGFVALDSFNFEATDGLTSDIGLVEIEVNGTTLPEGCGTIAVPIPCVAGR